MVDCLTVRFHRSSGAINRYHPGAPQFMLGRSSNNISSVASLLTTVTILSIIGWPKPSPNYLAGFIGFHQHHIRTTKSTRCSCMIYPPSVVCCTVLHEGSNDFSHSVFPLLSVFTNKRFSDEDIPTSRVCETQ